LASAAPTLWAGAASRASVAAVTASRIRISAVALLIAAVGGACGSGGDGGRLTGAKGTYASQVDPICKDLQNKIGQLGDNAEQQAKDVQDAVGRMKAVQIPRDDEAIAKTFIAAMENLYLALQDVDQSRKVNDQPRAEKAIATAKFNAQAAATAAKSYRMVECAQTL
jgi:hypothetical protein